MKKFLVRVILFALLVTACDYVLGRFAEYSVKSAGSGMSHKLNDIVSSANPDVVILGSSRCFRHYNPSIIGDPLDMPTYNMGMDGNGILLMYPYLANLIKRHTPKLVIYDMLPDFDLHDGNTGNCIEYLRYLKGCDEADSIMKEIDPNIPFKKLSYTYTYNSHFPSILRSLVAHKDSYTQGFQSVAGTLASDARPSVKSTMPYSALNTGCLDRLGRLCHDHGIQLVVAISPFYGTIDERDLEYIKGYCSRNNAAYLDLSRHPRFAGHPEMFADTYHLNHEGAEAFSHIIADTLRNCLNLPR